MWFSRYHVFRVDIGGAKLAGSSKIIATLEHLKGGSQQQLPKELAVLGIGRDRFGKLIMSHPPLDERIEALRNTPMMEFICPG